MHKKNIILGGVMLVVGIGLGVLLADAKPAVAPTQEDMHKAPAGDMNMTDTGNLYEVPKGEDAPALTLAVASDTEGGWNLHIKTTDFTFAPNHVGGANIDGEGHAHILIDGVMVGRAYSEWYYIPSLSNAKHTITVELETNNHKDYATDGKPVTASVDILPLGSAQTAGEKKEFSLIVKGRKLVSGSDDLEVKEGDTVAITITVDENEELHLHGYDMKLELMKDMPSTLTFVADTSGRFPFELEHSKTELGALSVYPK